MRVNNFLAVNSLNLWNFASFNFISVELLMVESSKTSFADFNFIRVEVFVAWRMKTSLIEFGKIGKFVFYRRKRGGDRTRR